MTDGHRVPGGTKPEKPGLLIGIDPNQDPMTRALEIQERCASVGFDWNAPSGARDKLFEEIAELDEACERETFERIESEVGDLLLAAINWARLLGTDPRRALDRTLLRFEERFAIVERTVAEAGKTLESCSLEELEAAWQRAKRIIAEKRHDESAQHMEAAHHSPGATSQ